MARRKKRSKTSMTVFGFIIFVLAVIGIVSVVRGSVNTVKNLSDDSGLKEKYEKYLSTVIMNDPDTFDDITGADPKQLISIAIWTLLESDTAPDDYEYVDAGMLVPAADVEKTFTSLFSTDVTPTHCTVDGGEAIEFKYDSTRKAYIVPITGISPVYTPDVIEINKKGTTVILTVAYLASADWEMAKDGSMVPPTPSKYVKVSMREDADGNTYISSIQNAADADYISVTTTEKETKAPSVSEKSKKAEETTAKKGK